MAKSKKKPDHEFYHYHNENPKGLSTGDCVVRAVSALLGIGWKATLTKMAENSLETCEMLNSKEGYSDFLAKQGYTKFPQPRREDRTKYTIQEFCKEIADKDKTYVVSCANHLTFVKDRKVWDIWDCGCKTVCNYWTKTK